MKTSKISDLLYCLGAAVVIFGAWAKILHKPFSDTMLTIGLLTEACLFVYMGISDLFKKSESVSLPPTIEKVHGNGTMVDNKELTNTLKETNNILRNVFNNKT